MRISCSFYYLVASTACFLHIMKIQVLAEREHKIETDVKEIRKTFFCELCNKQYKLAMEFEAHLSSYDHNHRKRFKEMREMHGSSRDDRQKREQQRQEREMAKFTQMAANKKQQEQQTPEEAGNIPAPSVVRTATALADQDQRKTLKFGFSAKGGSSKVTTSVNKSVKKPKVTVASVFSNESDEE